MAYSWPHISGTGAVATVTVDSHLAHSDDGGRTWLFDRALWRSEAERDPTTGEAGYSNHEAVSLYPRQTANGVVWYSARLRYFTRPGSGFKIGTFHLRVAQAASPLSLGDAHEGILGGALTPKEWQADTSLSGLAREVNGCTWSDPGILFTNDRIFLAAQCMLFSPQGELYDQEFVALFATQPEGPVSSWKWSYLGKLSNAQDAKELGGKSLFQTDLAHARDGRLLAIFSPSMEGERLEAHTGCVAVEVASLNPPMLARDGEGRLTIRARVTASDLAPQGPGACGYDASSETGIVIMRRNVGPGRLIGALYQTGLRP